MTEERAKQARTQKLQAQIDQTREVNAKRKMDKIGNREWDVVKQDGHWKPKRAWDEGKEDGDQQQKDENSEQPEAAGKGFPLSRLEEKKLEMQKLGIKPKSKSRMFSVILIFYPSLVTFAAFKKEKLREKLLTPMGKNGELPMTKPLTMKIQIRAIMKTGVQLMPTPVIQVVGEARMWATRAGVQVKIGT